MTTDILTYPNNNGNDSNDDKSRWKCPKCEKYYSKNYSYKNHLKRCVVHADHIDTKYQLLGDMLLELKQELKHDFNNSLLSMLNTIREDMLNNVKVNDFQPQQRQPKKIINPFSHL